MHVEQRSQKLRATPCQTLTPLPVPSQDARETFNGVFLSIVRLIVKTNNIISPEEVVMFDGLEGHHAYMRAPILLRPRRSSCKRYSNMLLGSATPDPCPFVFCFNGLPSAAPRLSIWFVCRVRLGVAHPTS